MQRRYQKILPQILQISTTMRSMQASLEGDIAVFDQMCQAAKDQYNELYLTILSGRKALSDFRQDKLKKLQQEAKQSINPMRVQEINEIYDRIEHFERRLDNLNRTCILAVQTVAQVRINQGTNREIVDRFDTTINLTVPAWKNGIIMALCLNNQRAALDMLERSDEVTNSMLKRIADDTHTGAVDAAKANQRGVIDIDTLQYVNNLLITTIRDVQNVQAQGVVERAKAEKAMEQLRDQLRNIVLDPTNTAVSGGVTPANALPATH